MRRAGEDLLLGAEHLDDAQIVLELLRRDELLEPLKRALPQQPLLLDLSSQTAREAERPALGLVVVEVRDLERLAQAVRDLELQPGVDRAAHQQRREGEQSGGGDRGHEHERHDELRVQLRAEDAAPPLHDQLHDVPPEQEDQNGDAENVQVHQRQEDGVAADRAATRERQDLLLHADQRQQAERHQRRESPVAPPPAPLGGRDSRARRGARFGSRAGWNGFVQGAEDPTGHTPGFQAAELAPSTCKSAETHDLYWASRSS
jgi:hypothetical protein